MKLKIAFRTLPVALYGSTLVPDAGAVEGVVGAATGAAPEEIA